MIVVDREYRADMLHGRTPIGEIVSTITEGDDALQLMAQGVARGAAASTAGLLFLDLETTGLFGGAGTQAFLVGCASIEGTSIRVRQFLLPGFEHERALLRELQAWAKSHGALCTYNGRTFDVPLIETRFMFHRRAVPARRRAAPRHAAPGAAACGGSGRWRSARPIPTIRAARSAVLEKQIAGLHRVGDVPGFEIPSRFFQFVRNGDARPLEAVLEHNRLDLISLAAVLARAIVLITRGPSAATTAQEAYGLARVYERGGALRQRRSGAAADDRVREARRRASPRCTARRCGAWRGFAAAIAGRTKPRRRGTSWRCCRDAPPRCGARRRKRWRSITSIASRICRRRASTRSICSREGVANPRARAASPRSPRTQAGALHRSACFPLN